MGDTANGVYFMLGSKRPRRRIVIVVHGSNVTYTYAITDPGTSTITTYKGPYGDPELDERTEVDASPEEPQ